MHNYPRFRSCDLSTLEGCVRVHLNKCRTVGAPSFTMSHEGFFVATLNPPFPTLLTRNCEPLPWTLTSDLSGTSVNLTSSGQISGIFCHVFTCRKTKHWTRKTYQPRDSGKIVMQFFPRKNGLQTLKPYPKTPNPGKPYPRTLNPKSQILNPSPSTR